MRTTIRLPKDILDRDPRNAAAENRTLTSLIEDGLRLIPDQGRSTQKREVLLPRISVATGGLLPGIDLEDSAALQEADDLDQIRRIR
jgi:hypothetical protein